MWYAGLRRIIYDALWALPSRLLSATLGIAGILATLSPENFKKWFAQVMTADQIQHYGGVAILVTLCYWALLFFVKPNKDNDPSAITQVAENHSSNINANSIGQVNQYIGHPPQNPEGLCI
jgi:hypothetical protein